MPTKKKLSDDDVDNTIADLVSVLDDLNVPHPSVVRAMADKGYSEEEVDEALRAFGERIGRTMGWS